MRSLSIEQRARDLLDSCGARPQETEHNYIVFIEKVVSGMEIGKWELHSRIFKEYIFLIFHMVSYTSYNSYVHYNNYKMPLNRALGAEKWTFNDQLNTNVSENFHLRSYASAD